MSVTDKLDATGNKIAGNVKEAAGKAIGNDKLAAEGKVQQVKGTAQDVKAASRARCVTTYDD